MIVDWDKYEEGRKLGKKTSYEWRIKQVKKGQEREVVHICPECASKMIVNPDEYSQTQDMVRKGKNQEFISNKQKSIYLGYMGAIGIVIGYEWENEFYCWECFCKISEKHFRDSSDHG